MTTESLQLQRQDSRSTPTFRAVGRDRIAIACVLLALAIAALLAMALARVMEGVVQILAVVAGMLTAGSAKALVDGMHLALGRRLPRVQFSEVEEKLLPAGTSSPGERGYDSSTLDERLLINLLAVDPNAALARLRMEIESALRRFAATRNVDVSNRPVSVQRLIDLLGEHLALSERVVLTEVARACNDAIHGAVVDQQTAARVMDAGIQALRRLP